MENEKENIVESEVTIDLNGKDNAELSSRKGGDSHWENDHSEGAPDESLEEEHKSVDYTTFSKEDFVELVKELSKENNFRHIDNVLKEAKPVFDDIRQKERSAALDRFKEDGGKTEDFDYKHDEFDVVFDATVKLMRDRKTQYFKNLEEEKNENLRKKLEILEKLRVLVDSNDTEHGFHSFKTLQREWKNIGAVPMVQAKSLWASYNALVDLFYDHRSIYFELKELDRRKNLEAKAELCARAEKLVNAEKIKDAVRELNELHDEFKHVGPVPAEEKENVWQRFKAASDKVYEKRDAYVSKLQQDFQNNLVVKEQLVDEIQKLSLFTSDRIKEWNQRTQEILEVQKKWEAIGGVSRNKSKEINKRFWSAFKSFFNNKNTFFRKLDQEREHNLQLKNDIVKKAQELKDSFEWENTANALKELQKQWKEVGPVPEKFRDKVFQDFKDACDHFFGQRRGQLEKQDHEQDENLKLKEAVCTDLEKEVEAGTGSLESLASYSNRFNEIGYVPKKYISSIKDRFHAASQKYIASLTTLQEDEKEKALLEIELSGLKGDPHADRKLHHKEQAIRKRIIKIENDIALWRNNLEFFGRSKNADKVKDEFNAKIEEAIVQLNQLKSQLKMLKTVS
jgi:Domain of Unknown Function (DUF349)